MNNERTIPKYAPARTKQYRWYLTKYRPTSNPNSIEPPKVAQNAYFGAVGGRIT
jgi:hypothetical protein